MDRRSTDLGLTEGDLHIQSLKTGIVWHGLFSSDAFSGVGDVHPSVWHIIKMFRWTLDFCMVDIMESSGRPERIETLRWMETEGFDEFCYLCHLEPTYVLKVMDKTFERFKKTTAGKDWVRPNLNYRKVKKGKIVAINLSIW